MSDLIIDINLNSIDAIIEHFSTNKDAFAELKLPLTAENIGSPTRIKILAHAVAVFQRKGIDNTTVKDFIEEANVSRRTFYKYFKNRVDVLESLYQIGAELQTLRFITVIRSCLDMDEVVRKSVDLYFDFHGSLGRIISSVQEDALRSSSPLHKHRRNALRESARVLTSELERLTGESYEELQIYSALWALESSSLHLLNDTASDSETIDYYKKSMQTVVKSILAGHKPEAS